WVLLREVEHNRDGFRENEVAIDEHRQLASGVHREKLATPMLSLARIDVDVLELDVQLAQRPENADRASRRESIELHGLRAPSVRRGKPRRDDVTADNGRACRPNGRLEERREADPPRAP